MGIAILISKVSFADANLGKVTLSEEIPLQSISIIANESYIGIDAQLTCSFSPLATTQRDVVWSIVSGNQYATIDTTTGKLSILEGASDSSVTVKATSSSNSNISAIKELRVTYDASGNPLIIREGSSLVSDGTAYLDATKYFTGARRWNWVALTLEITFALSNDIAIEYAMFGGRATTESENSVNIRTTNSLAILTGQPTIPDTPLTKNKKYTLKIDHGNVSLMSDGNPQSLGVVSQQSTNTANKLFLFCRNLEDKPTVLQTADSTLKIYSAKMSTDADGEVFDFVPCTYEGVAAMYDRISEKAVYSETEGTFSIQS